jgi:hypothetical protein
MSHLISAKESDKSKPERNDDTPVTLEIEQL